MKLMNITFGTTPRLPGIRPAEMNKIDCQRPGPALAGWRLLLRGQQAFFVSPPGWVTDQSEKTRDPKGPVTIYEVSRSEVILHWQGGIEDLEPVLKGGRYDSPPFGWQPVVVDTVKPILGQIPAGQVGDA